MYRARGGHAWGGKIVTHQVGDLITEAGPDSFLSTKPAGLELVAKLGLTDQLINTNETGKKAFVYLADACANCPKVLLRSPRDRSALF